MNKKFVYKRAENYFWEKTLVEIFKPLIIVLVNTPITPNMVTIFNLVIIFPLGCIVALKRMYTLTALFIQLYCILDVIDGNLARNKGLTSELGKKLDQICDFIFYSFFYLVVGISFGVNIVIVVLSVFIQHIYGMIATYYIVPRIRSNSHFRRTKLKTFFYDRGVLFGMDATFQNLITSILLLTPLGKYCFIINSMCWLIDILYRLYEINIFNKRS